MNERSLFIYGKNIQKALERNFIHFMKLHIDYLELYDVDDVFEKLSRFFMRR